MWQGATDELAVLRPLYSARGLVNRLPVSACAVVFRPDKKRGRLTIRLATGGMPIVPALLSVLSGLLGRWDSQLEWVNAILFFSLLIRSIAEIGRKHRNNTLGGKVESG